MEGWGEVSEPGLDPVQCCNPACSLLGSSARMVGVAALNSTASVAEMGSMTHLQTDNYGQEAQLQRATWWFSQSRSASSLVFFVFCYLFISLLFMFGCVGSLLLCAGFSLVAASRGYSCGARASHCGGFSCCWSMGSRCAGFSSCGTWAQ